MSYSPKIEPGESYRKTYGQSPNGKPGGCFQVTQMWAVRSLSDRLDWVDANTADGLRDSGRSYRVPIATRLAGRGLWSRFVMSVVDGHSYLK